MVEAAVLAVMQMLLHAKLIVRVVSYLKNETNFQEFDLYLKSINHFKLID